MVDRQATVRGRRRRGRLEGAGRALTSIALAVLAATLCCGGSVLVTGLAFPRVERSSAVGFTITSTVYATYTSAHRTCTGTPRALLYPGTQRCLDLTVSNPHRVGITVTTLEVVRVARATRTAAHSSCRPTASTFATFAATDFTGGLEVGAERAASVARPLIWGAVGGEDSCEGARFAFTYSGKAHDTGSPAPRPAIAATSASHHPARVRPAA